MSTSLDEYAEKTESGEPDLTQSYSPSLKSGGAVSLTEDKNNQAHVAKLTTHTPAKYHSIVAEIEDEIEEPVEPWEKCAKFVWDREMGRIDDWNRELDAMLLFAGLFSAAVTAFSVPYYTSFFTPATTVSLAQTLAQLSQTLAVNSHGPNTSHSAFVTSAALDAHAQTTSTESPMRVSALWSVALVFSLSAASIAIYIKQWLTQLAAPMTSMPRQSVVIWYRRHRSIQQWAIPSVIALVPCLLQIALIIFLAGLVLLLWTLETTLFAVVMPLVGLLMLFSICIAVLPSIAANCPYKSPQALIVVNIFTMISTLVSLIRNMIHTPDLHSDPAEKHHHGPSHSSDILKSLGYSIKRFCVAKPILNDARNWIIYNEWQEYERYAIEALDLESMCIADVDLLAAVDRAMRDDGFLREVLMHYVKTSPNDRASKALFHVYCARTREGNTITRDAASQVERMALRVFEDIMKRNSSHPFVPNELVEVFAMLSDDSRFPMFPMLFDILQKFNGDRHESLQSLMLIVASNFRQFAHHLDHKFYMDFIQHIPDMLNKDNTTGVVQTTLEVLLTCGTHPETSKEEMHLIGRNIYKAFSPYSGGSNQRIDASSNTECVAYLDVVDACLAATEKRISAFLTMSKGEYHALSEKTQEDDGNGEEVVNMKKEKLRERMIERTKEKDGFMQWRERLSAIRKMQRSASNTTEFAFSMNYGDIAADLPYLGLKPADVFRFSYLFFE